MTKRPLVAIVGPTASGKTAVPVELAKRLGAEIVSADSMQIYKRMEIATAKPTEAEMRGVRHHLIDFFLFFIHFLLFFFHISINRSAFDCA